jgi:hypothetical protein
VRRETHRTATGTVALPQKNKCEIISEKGCFSEIFPVIRNSSTSINPAFLEGRKMGWAEKWSFRCSRLCRLVRRSRCGEGGSGYGGQVCPSIFLPSPFGATKRAHLQILAQKAKIVQPMVGGFF